MTIETEFGVRFANGSEDWATETWFGSISTPAARRNFTEQYELRLATLGVPSPGLEFVTRTRELIIGEATVLPEDEPEVLEDAPESLDVLSDEEEFPDEETQV